MNILVIGNGFDLAHGLPTSYSNFLKFCEQVRKIYDYYTSSADFFRRSDLGDLTFDDLIKKRLENAIENRENKQGMVTTTDKALNELHANIAHNTWLEYFLNCPSYIGENWIDFESEISNVIRSLDYFRDMIKKEKKFYDIRNERSLIITSIMKAGGILSPTVIVNVKDIDDFSDKLNTELKRLSRALEIYICEFVGQIKVGKRSVDIEGLQVDHILSFNYSNTYERLYGKDKDIEYDYLHGKADINNSLETNNMVLGIDEYLLDDEKDKKIEFIAFKKYYQRMYKKSKRLTEYWCAEIKKEAEYEKHSRNFMMEEQIKFELVKKGSGVEYNWQNYEKLTKVYDEQYIQVHPKHNVYIFGHSLDVTDKDILRDLILNDNVNTTIYYCKKKDANGHYDNGGKDYGQKLANLVKVIGQNELIKRTGGSTKTIEFKLQQDMVEEI